MSLFFGAKSFGWCFDGFIFFKTFSGCFPCFFGQKVITLISKLSFKFCKTTFRLKSFFKQPNINNTIKSFTAWKNFIIQLLIVLWRLSYFKGHILKENLFYYWSKPKVFAQILKTLSDIIMKSQPLKMMPLCIFVWSKKGKAKQMLRNQPKSWVKPRNSIFLEWTTTNQMFRMKGFWWNQSPSCFLYICFPSLEMPKILIPKIIRKKTF